MHPTKTTAKSWTPPHCPNSNCVHHNDLTLHWSYKKIGPFRRLIAPKCIQRFICNSCKRSFSTQTFDATYWQKRPDLDQRIFMKTVGGMANRQIARDINVSPATVDRHIARIGRHCMLLHHNLMQHSPPVKEVVIDGFESFEYSQYFPMHHHVAVEKGTDFFIHFTDSELRRKGRMTDLQKKRRQHLEMTLGRPDPKSIEKDIRELLEVALDGQDSAVVYSDDHPAYKRSIKNLRIKIDHRITLGKEHRDKNNSLWEVNLLDLIIRHSSANHRRETLAWSKRRQSSAYRLAILLVWRNYLKGRREKVRGSPTPAMERGMLERPLKLAEVFGKRLFRTRCTLTRRWGEYYEMAVKTRAIIRPRKHELKYAF